MMLAENRAGLGALDFCPLASGSSGNCIYLATGNANILIDAGLSGIRIERALTAIGVHPTELDAIFITHEHSDHISGAGVMARRFGVPIFTTEGTWDHIDRTGSLGKLRHEQRRLIHNGGLFDFRDITVRPFAIPHDANEPVGYSFFAEGTKVTIATDMGFVSQDCHEAIKDADILLIEANHDIEMLKNGSYPFYLKKRILGEKGHLSNVSCGEALTGTAGSKRRHVYLGHLSEENNRPMLAYDTVKDILEAAGIGVRTPEVGTEVSREKSDIRLYLAERHTVSKHLRISPKAEDQEA